MGVGGGEGHRFGGLDRVQISNFCCNCLYCCQGQQACRDMLEQYGHWDCQGHRPLCDWGLGVPRAAGVWGVAGATEKG